MIVGAMQLAQRCATDGEHIKDVVPILNQAIARYEKLLDDICAAAAIDGNERVTDLIEEEMEEA